MDTAAFDQDSFRGRNDNGSETTATWKADTNIDWTQDVDENFRVRFLIQETAGNAKNNVNHQLQYNLASADWNDVTNSSSVVISVLSGNFADGDDTTQQIGGGTFLTSNDGMDEADGDAGGNALDYAGSDETEVEYCIQIVSGDVVDAQTIELRVLEEGSTLGAYTKTPSVTVNEANPVLVDVPTGALTLTGLVPIVLTPVVIDVPTATLTLVGQVPAVGIDLALDIPLGALALSGLIPTILTPVVVDIPTGALTLASSVPVILTPRLVDIPVASLNLSGNAPLVLTPRLINIPVAALNFSTFAPTVIASSTPKPVSRVRHGFFRV